MRGVIIAVVMMIVMIALVVVTAALGLEPGDFWASVRQKLKPGPAAVAAIIALCNRTRNTRNHQTRMHAVANT